MRIDEEAQPADEEASKLDSGVVTSGSKPKKKPMLMLQVSEHFGDDEKHTGDTPKEHVHRNEPKIVNGVNVANADSRISPNGTLYMGKVKVLENGIVSEKLSGTRAQAGYSYEDIKRNFRQDRGYIAQTNAETGRHSWVLHRNESGRVIDPYDFQRQQSQLQGDDDDTPLPSMSKKDFIEIATLGSGASGVVSEAIHVPTLTLVALKMLPVYNHEKRLHVSRELGVLYRNLAEMRLVDDLYGEGGSQDESDSARQSSTSSNKARCPNVLSLYNAFKDPSSGMINLVVEYMDGGSLEDLVRAGGCQDERILADIAFQTLTGLAYLHKNKNVHRDIKPANILCSSSGLIKIADFGISKALDKTTGFANSFVGTVSYMSPERITAESYSFPCDIWSLGLTILAVAKGRFPISTRSKKRSPRLDAKDDGSDDGNAAVGRRLQADDEEDEDEDEPMVIAGPGGYWAMIKAICDDEPPVAGSKFSRSFNDFIDHCLQKDARDRRTARQLLDESPFVVSHVPTQAQQPSSGPSNGAPKLQSPQKDSNLSSPDNSTTPTDITPRTQRPSALKARLTAVTITKNNNDLLASPKPSAPPRTLLDELDLDDLGLGQDEMAAIYAIRLEHLGTVLQKIAQKLQLGDVTSPDSATLSDSPGYSPERFAVPHASNNHQYPSKNPFTTDSSQESLDGDELFNLAAPPPGKFSSHRPPPADEKQHDRSSHVNKSNRAIAALTADDDDEAAELPPLSARSGYAHNNNGASVNGNNASLQKQRSILKQSQGGDSAAYNAFSSSVRSVHFHQNDDDDDGGGDDKVDVQQKAKDPVAEEKPTAAAPKGLRGRLNLKALQLEVDDSDARSLSARRKEDADRARDEEEDQGGAASLPRPSSYFIRSQQSKDDDSAATDHDHGDATHNHHSAQSTAAIAAVEYRRMLPKLDARGQHQWQHLADQLNLPLQVVLLAARAHLQAVLDSSPPAQPNSN
eukprot:gene4054-2890_t